MDKFDLKPIPAPLRKSALKYLLDERRLLAKEASLARLQAKKTDDFQPKSTTFWRGKEYLQEQIEPMLQKQLFEREMDRRIELLQQENAALQTSNREGLNNLRNALKTYYADQRRFKHILMGADVTAFDLIQQEADENAVLGSLAEACSYLATLLTNAREAIRKDTLEWRTTREQHAAQRQARLQHQGQESTNEELLKTVKSLQKQLNQLKNGGGRSDRGRHTARSRTPTPRWKSRSRSRSNSTRNSHRSKGSAQGRGRGRGRNQGRGRGRHHRSRSPSVTFRKARSQSRSRSRSRTPQSRKSSGHGRTGSGRSGSGPHMPYGRQSGRGRGRWGGRGRGRRAW
jgi:hypothetical protein